MRDLHFLFDCTSDELDILVSIMVKKGQVIGKTPLEKEKNYKKYYPKHEKYVSEIIRSYLDFGGNEFKMLFGGLPTYMDVLRLTAEKIDVETTENETIDAIETKILEKLLQPFLKDLTPEAEEELLQALGGRANFPNGISEEAIFQGLRLGGAVGGNIALLILNGVGSSVAGKALYYAAGGMAVAQVGHVAAAGIGGRALALLTGPVGAAIMGVWAIYDIYNLAGPAYRVIVPATTCIAALRRVQKARSRGELDIF